MSFSLYANMSGFCSDSHILYGCVIEQLQCIRYEMNSYSV